MPWTTLCALDDLTEGAGKYVEIDGHKLAVYLHQGHPHVLDNYCPHAGGSLAAGFVDDGCAVCPWHYWKFRLTDGQLTSSQHVRVATYPARVTDGTVEADLLPPT